MRLTETIRARLAVALIFINVNFTGDMYVLSLPLLSHRFDVGQGLLHQTMTIFLLGMLISFLISGSIIRRLNTYKSQIIGFMLMLIGTTLCLTLLSVKIFFTGRLFEGLGAGMLMIVTRTILLNQSTSQNKRTVLTKHFSYVAIFSAWAPVISIFIGGLIAHTLGPRFVFIILLIITIIIAISQLTICKDHFSATKSTSELKTSTVKIYYQLIQNARFIATSLALSLLCSTIPIFFISYGFIVNHVQYTWIVGIVSVFTTSGILLGKFLSYKVFPGNVSIKKIITYCSIGCMISSIMMCFNFSTTPSISLLIASYTLFIFFVGLLSPATNAYIANFNPPHQEITVGLSMSLIYSIGVIENYLAGHLQITSELKLGIVLGVFSLTAMLVNLVLNSGNFHKKQQKPTTH